MGASSFNYHVTILIPGINAFQYYLGDVESGVEHLSKAVAVCSQPQQLLQVLQQTLPPQVFQLLLQRLPAVSQVSIHYILYEYNMSDNSPIISSINTSSNDLYQYSKPTNPPFLENTIITQT